ALAGFKAASVAARCSERVSSTRAAGYFDCGTESVLGRQCSLNCLVTFRPGPAPQPRGRVADELQSTSASPSTAEQSGLRQVAKHRLNSENKRARRSSGGDSP